MPVRFIDYQVPRCFVLPLPFEKGEDRGSRLRRHLLGPNPHPPLSLANGEATPIRLNAKLIIRQRYR
jgi:hypothetical protein